MTKHNVPSDQKKLIETQIVPLVKRSATLVVKNTEERLELVQEIKAKEELKIRIEERFHPTANKQLAYENYTNALDTEKQFYAPINQFISAAKGAIKTYDTKEAIRIAKEKEIAEAKKKNKEAKAKEKLLDKAEEAQEIGNTTLAKTLRTQARTYQAPLKFDPPAEPVKKLVWKARVIDMKKLCTAISAGLVPASVLEVNVSALNDFAKNHDGVKKIGGLEFIQEVSGRI